MDRCVITTPAGNLVVKAKEGCITECGWTDEAVKMAETPLLQNAAKELAEYFSGDRHGFDLPLAAEGTDFQKAIWRAIATVPYGKTLSYSELAQRAGYPQAIRAGANACGANPISIIVPCHRIVAKHGMGGYTGGLDKKKALWQVEQIQLYGR